MEGRNAGGRVARRAQGGVRDTLVGPGDEDDEDDFDEDDPDSEEEKEENEGEEVFPIDDPDRDA